MGSTNQRTSNLIDHATSDAHKAVMAMLKVERSRVRGESAATSTMIRHFFVINGRRNAREDGEEVQRVLHDGKRELTVHQIPRIVGTRISPWS